MEEEELFKAHRNTRPGSSKRTIRDPALAIAVAKCWLARLMGNDGISAIAHPFPCKICQIPTEDILPVFDEWIEWSGLETEEHSTPLEAFLRLSSDTQRELVMREQGYKKDSKGNPIPGDKEYKRATGVKRRKTRVT